MSGAPHDGTRILLIASHKDAPVMQCAKILEDSGGQIEWASDVYSAMAALARRVSFACVVIDSRHLDQVESEFLSLAPRYFPDVNFVVPAMDSEPARAGSVRRVPMERLKECVTPAPASAPPPGWEESFDPLPAWAEQPPSVVPPQADPPKAEPQQAAKLSTDDGAKVDEDGLSLHEAVRRRMAADDPRMIRRRPPSAPRGPTPKDTLNRSEPDPSTISDEEIRALLDPRESPPRSPGEA